MPIPTDVAYAHEQDRHDPLAAFRDAFVITDPDIIYLDGNSLGRLPKLAATRMREAVEQQWGQRLIRGWREGWFEAPQRIGAKIAQLIGAQPDEVIVCDSTSVNLFKLVSAALQARSGRTKVVSDDLNFPSDLYILQGVLQQANAGHHLHILRSPDGLTIDDAQIDAAITNDTALVALTHTCFKSGWLYDMRAVTERAHQAGALMLWDLCHSVGAVPLSLNEANVDLAVGCTYKYLNGGPGAPAFLYVRRDLQEQLLSPIWGWFGQQNQFNFDLTYRAGAGIQRFLAGTPPILALTAVEAGVDVMLEAGMEPLRQKSIQQTEYLIGLWEEWLAPLGVTLNSPRDPSRRGSHVSLGHPEGWRINLALIEQMNVVPDFRAPDNIRLGIAPIYTSYAEIHEAMRRMREVIVQRSYEQYSTERHNVT
jgi:kynureninase